MALDDALFAPWQALIRSTLILVGNSTVVAAFKHVWPEKLGDWSSAELPAAGEVKGETGAAHKFAVGLTVGARARVGVPVCHEPVRFPRCRGLGRITRSKCWTKPYSIHALKLGVGFLIPQ